MRWSLLNDLTYALRPQTEEGGGDQQDEDEGALHF